MHPAQPGARPLLVALRPPVQTYDIDFAGHVNNQVYVRWLEDLRMEILRRHYPLDRIVADGVFPVLVNTNITYKRPLVLTDAPEARMWCAALGRATIHLEAEISLDGALCAHATQRGILLKMDSGKPARIPPDLAARFHAENRA